jgi:hypothetical protein
LELGNREAVSKLEGTLVERVGEEGSGGEGRLSGGEVVNLLHVLHKYKAGGLDVWRAIERHFLAKHKKIPFEHLFLLMSGLTRNYAIKGEYLQQLIEADAAFSYAGGLSDKQFVEFYFVLYAHFTVLPSPLQQKYEPLLLSAVRAP